MGGNPFRVPEDLWLVGHLQVLCFLKQPSKFSKSTPGGGVAS